MSKIYSIMVEEIQGPWKHGQTFHPYIIHDNEVNNIAEGNLLHDIINPPKHAKNINIHYSPILYGCMNTGKGRSKYKTLWIILDSGCSSTIIIRRLVEKLHPGIYSVMQW